MTIPRRFARYSKMTPELEAKLRRQIELRRELRSWTQIADEAGMSRRSVYYHMRRLEKAAAAHVPSNVQAASLTRAKKSLLERITEYLNGADETFSVWGVKGRDVAYWLLREAEMEIGHSINPSAQEPQQLIKGNYS